MFVKLLTIGGLGWTAVFASEGTFFVVLVNYWAGGAVPEGALCMSLILTHALIDWHC